MLRSDVIGEDGRLRQVLFRADSTELNLLEHLKKGEVMKMAIDVHALNNIAFFTRLKPAFTAPPPEKKMGCAAIEWMKELMPDKILDKMGIGPGHPCDGSKHKDKVEAWKKRNSLGVRKSSPQESAFLQTL